MSETPLVSVIVPAYRAGPALERCLDALAAQTYPADRLDVVVVENGDGDLDPARKRRVRWLREPKPGSYAARNRGAREAKGDVLAFTDADCVPTPAWIEAGVRRWTRDDGNAVIGGRVALSFRGARPGLCENFDALFLGFPQDGFAREGFAATANMMCGRALFESTGGFDGALRSGGDYEWGRRARAAGAVIAYDADTVVAHPARASFAEIVRKVRRLAGGLWLLSRHRGGRGARVLALVRTEVGRWRDMRQRLRETRETTSAFRRGQLFVLAAVVQALRVVETLRLAAGGAPRR